jgi:hypothetical protein
MRPRRVIVSRASGAPELLNLDSRAHFQHISRRRHMQVRGEFSHMGCPWAVRAAVRPLRSEPERTPARPASGGGAGGRTGQKNSKSRNPKISISNPASSPKVGNMIVRINHSGLTIVIIRAGRNDDDERHINGHTAVSGYRVRTLHSTDMRFMDMRAKINHLGVPGFVRSGMQQAARTSASQQGSLDTGTAWAYCSPASRTLETLILTFTE